MRTALLGEPRLALLTQAPLLVVPLVDGPGRLWALGAWGLASSLVTAALLLPRVGLSSPVRWKAGAGGGSRVALTFDDGPHPEDTPALLGALRAAGVRATFFFVGQRMRRHPELVRAVAAAGHEVEPHSDTHPWWFSLAGPRRVECEVARSASTVEELTGRRPEAFRPPVGHDNVFLGRALRRAGLELTTWSVRSLDTLGGSPESIRRRVLRRARPGSIVLLHEGVRRAPGRPSPTVSALPGLIAGLRHRGLEPVSLGILLGCREPGAPRSATSP